MFRHILYLLISFSVISKSYAEDQEKVALRTIKKLGKTLKVELKRAISVSPERALSVCNVKAPIIQKDISNKELQVGRVSFKNRNPKNSPKDWMKSYMKDFHSGKITKPYIVVNLDDNKKGLLKPISTAPLCLNCHGKAISQNLANKIKELYPADKAVGYSAGEIRGFFWAEY